MAEPFHFHDGTQVHTISQLLHHLENDESKYTAHIRAEANDFASWVEGSLKLPLLAHQLKESRTREETIAALRSYLKHTAPTNPSHVQQGTKQRVFVSGVCVGILVGFLLAFLIQVLL